VGGERRGESAGRRNVLLPGRVDNLVVSPEKNSAARPQREGWEEGKEGGKHPPGGGPPTRMLKRGLGRKGRGR